MERLREITVRVEVDTNKATHVVELKLDDDESIDELFKRAQQWAEERLP